MTNKKTEPRIYDKPARGLAGAAAELDFRQLPARRTAQTVREIELAMNLHHGLLKREFKPLTNSELTDVIAVCLQILDDRGAVASLPTNEELGR
ncbi:hypothetical protein [Thalassoroseus pseudoceratinae]|uniref:hypothetical protein n=1 Tax=Thalassoroseus pseudoceratinae TaxID=2713176 RepID=UPI0014219092|nr:hypothetical protein [Thalassoroseus pseudoceratinae]